MEAQISSMQAGANVLGFIRHLRNAEFDVTAHDAILIGRTLTGLSRPDLNLSRNTSRALCCKSQDQWKRFDALFNAYWLRSRELPDNDVEIDRPGEISSGGVVGLGGSAAGLGGDTGDTSSPGMGAGRQTTLSKADFRFLNDKDAMRRTEELAERLARQTRQRLSRRKKLTKQSGSLSLRATLRASVRTGGVPIHPWHMMRRHEPPRLVLLLDVSHSMTFNNPLLFRFVRGLVRRFHTAEAFVFHTSLHHVTPILRQTSITRMRASLEQGNNLWLGGTCIADSLTEFREKFAASVLKTDSQLIIISDGFDANEPERLKAELQLLKRQCRRLIWLNPMLERKGFNADKEDVWNIRRNVDHLLPAHSLDALRRSIQAIST